LKTLNLKDNDKEIENITSIKNMPSINQEVKAEKD
jgi:hypothetical protein